MGLVPKLVQVFTWTSSWFDYCSIAKQLTIAEVEMRLK
jgi:hypothetical protein